MAALFHQEFGLARDPTLANDWRIQYSVLQLSGSRDAALADGAHAPALGLPGGPVAALEGPHPPLALPPA